jgi:uncharacterized protein YbjT (DUF2867 family)
MMKKLLTLMFLTSLLGLAGCERPAPEAAPENTPEPAAEVVIEPAQEAALEPMPADDDRKLILVTGATGTQGGAVARELLERGYAVRALTRDPESEESQALAGLGAEMVQGDYADTASIAAAMEGVDGVFAVTLFWPYGYEDEVTQGRMLIDQATQAGVGQFVLTSVAGADDGTGIPHFESKWEIEQYLHDSELNWAVVRPVEFMDNWSLESFHNGRMIDPRAPESSHQWIAASDIGFFVGEAFDKPDSWAGMTREIAGDQLTLEQLREMLSEVFGQPFEHVRPSWEDFTAESGGDVATMYQWFEEDGYDVDIVSLRKWYPNLVTVRQYLNGLAPQPGE